MSVRFFSLTDCLYIAVALQRCMDDPSFVRIHRFQNYRFSGFLYLEGDSSCKVFQSFFTAASVVLCIKLYTNVSLSLIHISQMASLNWPLTVLLLQAVPVSFPLELKLFPAVLLLLQTELDVYKRQLLSLLSNIIFSFQNLYEFPPCSSSLILSLSLYTIAI